MAGTSDYLPDYPDEYHQSFQTMMDYGGRFRELRYKEDSIKTVDKLQLESCNQVYVLSIGPGNGSADLHFINALVDKYTTIHYTVVEPVSGPLDEFKRLIESHQDKWNRVNFSFHVQGITEYLKEGGAADKYDFIHACHSLYFFGDVGNTLHTLYNMLNVNGILLIRAVTGKGVCKYRKYRNNFQGSRKHITGIDAKNLISLQFPNVPIEIIHGPIEVTVTKCFDKDSRDGNRLLDFINEIVNFRNSRPPNEVEASLKYLRDHCCYFKEDEIMINNDESDIIIWKN